MRKVQTSEANVARMCCDNSCLSEQTDVLPGMYSYCEMWLVGEDLIILERSGPMEGWHRRISMPDIPSTM